MFVVEGFTDTAALTAAGLSAVGRPSNVGGAKYLGVLLADWPAGRPIILVIENDLKKSGIWPGRDGTVHVAGELSRILNRPVRCVAVPDSAKDVREWLTRTNLRARRGGSAVQF